METARSVRRSGAIVADMTTDEIKAAGREMIAAAMRRRGHVPGVVRTERTSRGTFYTFTRCSNVQGKIQCHVEAEYSVERERVTQSTVAFWCSFETADQKLDRRSETERHWHVEKNGETISWAWIYPNRSTAQTIASRWTKGHKTRDRYTIREHTGPCQLFREHLGNWAGVPPVTEGE